MGEDTGKRVSELRPENDRNFIFKCSCSFRDLLPCNLSEQSRLPLVDGFNNTSLRSNFRSHRRKGLLGAKREQLQPNEFPITVFCEVVALFVRSESSGTGL